MKKSVVGGTLVAVVAYGAMLLSGNGSDSANTSHSAGNTQPTPEPASQDLNDTPITFTDTLDVYVNCYSPNRGYEILNVDGHNVRFVNGNHTVTLAYPGTHTLRMWGSCYPELR